MKETSSHVIGIFFIALAVFFMGVVAWENVTYQALSSQLAQVVAPTAAETDDITAMGGEEIAVSFAGAALSASSKYPGFSVRFSDGVFKQYVVNEKGMYDDADIAAIIKKKGKNEWILALTSKTKEINQVHFPWEAARSPLNSDRNDAVIYSPIYLGSVQKDTGRGEFAWTGYEYPGISISPLLVAANESEAKLVAATNWPPRTVTPLYSLNRIVLRYNETVAPGNTKTYSAMIAKVKKKNTTRPTAEPWQMALDIYKKWLKKEMKSARLTPVYPEWMWNSQGWINVQLENRPTFDLAANQDLWNKTKNYFGWIQFWGQMSNYGGLASLAVPPLQPGELVGCCVDTSVMHDKYDPELISLADSITASGGHVGYYSRPHPIDPEGSLFSSAGVEQTANTAYVLDWLSHNKNEYKANAFYIDTLGHDNFGETKALAEWIRDKIPQDSVIEFGVDVYPSAFLMSGSLEAVNDTVDPAGTRTMAPRFGRYLLDDRIIFLGESNGDHLYWGPSQNYALERQAFLLGAKLDIMRPFEPGGEAAGTLDEAIRLIIEKRNQKNWWARKPVYMDRAELAAIPSGIDVRRFQGSGKEDIFVIDNWQQQSGQSFTFKNRQIDIPLDKLSILVFKGNRLE